MTLESDIKDSISLLAIDSTNYETELSLWQIEIERNNILKGVEERWRLRNRAIWMASGDSNTKYFHHFANYRINLNTIWEIKNEEGNSSGNAKEWNVYHAGRMP